MFLKNVTVLLDNKWKTEKYPKKDFSGKKWKIAKFVQKHWDSSGKKVEGWRMFWKSVTVSTGKKVRK